MDNIVSKIIKNKVVLVNFFSVVLHFILLLSSVASNQWVIGKTRYSSSYDNLSYGLWKGCLLDITGSQYYCESFVSSSWLDGVKALTIIPLIILGLAAPLLLFYGWDETPLKQLSTGSGSYRISIFAGMDSFSFHFNFNKTIQILYFFIFAYNISKHPKEIKGRGFSDAPNEKKKNEYFFLS